MNNYQLYRTNPLLGGQLKWDIIVDSDIKDLYVSDFHITPLSDQVPYNKYVDDTLLNYSHQYNVKKYFSKIRGSFYQNYIKPQLNHKWPIIDDGSYIQVYDDTYFMGCKRSNYDIYKKQFEFLCPVWIEQLSDNIIFTINIRTNNDNKSVIASKSLTIDKSIGKEYHDKFTSYLKDYIKYIGLDEGNDKVININLSKKTASLDCLDVVTGEKSVKNISNLATNILMRERPLMEFDSMIIDSFKNNNSICNQLFNFNICFNVEDIIPQTYISDMMKGDSFIFECVVKVDGNVLDIKDLYNNFEFIPKKYSGVEELDSSIPTPNVLDYLDDYKYVEFMDKNRISPSIIHWSLTANNDYIFNVYDGFGGWSYSNGKYVYHSHLFNDTPDLTQTSFSPTLNNINWCNRYEINSYDDYYLIKTNQVPESPYSRFGKDIKWVNNVQYNIMDDTFDSIGIILCKINNNPDKDKIYKELEQDRNTEKINDIYCKIIKDTNDNVYIMLICDDYEYFTFNFIRRLFDRISSEKFNKEFEYIKNVLNSAIDIPLVVFKKSLFIDKADSPSLSSNEIMYYKNDGSYMNYVFRYDGNIRPTFISVKDSYYNLMYYKKVLKKEDVSTSVFAKFNDSKYPPIFPSIDYYALNNVKMNYESLDNSLSNNYEDYKWFNNSKHIYLIPNIKCDIESIKNDQGDYLKISELIKKYLKKYYNIDNEGLLDYINNLYNIESSYEYKSLDNIDDYIYTINLTLK